jgi:hypothetical protein
VEMCFTMSMPSNGRLFSLHYSGFRRHVTVSDLMATQNDVAYCILAADAVKLVILQCTILSDTVGNVWKSPFQMSSILSTI